MASAYPENLDPISELTYLGFHTPEDHANAISEERMADWISRPIENRQVPFIYKSNSITAPGSIFTANEVRHILSQENRQGGEWMAFAIHGNINALGIDITNHANFYTPSDEEKDLIDHTIDSTDWSEYVETFNDIGPNEFISLLQGSGLNLSQATELQAHQGCAVLNTAQKIYLATRFLKKFYQKY